MHIIIHMPRPASADTEFRLEFSSLMNMGETCIIAEMPQALYGQMLTLQKLTLIPFRYPPHPPPLPKRTTLSCLPRLQNRQRRAL